MRKFIVGLCMLMIMVSIGSGYWWDTEKILQGRQMVEVGGPWFGDDAKMYFGDDKDASIFFNSSSGAAEVVGLTAVNNISIVMESGEDITFAGGDSKMDLSAGTGVFKTPAGAVTIGPGAITMSGATTLSTVAVGVNASTTNDTVLTSSSTKTVYDMDASAANVTLTLPDAATVPGRMYFISVSGNPGANYARVTATGGDDINANNYLVSNEQWSTAVIVASNGAYRALTSGTWAAHA